MALQYSEDVRDAQLDAFETVVGTSPKLRIYSGSVPADCAAAESGTLLVELDLPSDFMAAASGGSKAKSGTWSATVSDDGEATHWRVYDSGATTCHAQGTATATGGGGDLELITADLVAGQILTINTASITAGNA